MAHASALNKYLEGQISNSEITPPGTPAGGQDSGYLENRAGDLSTNSHQILTRSTLQVPEKISAKNLGTVIYDPTFPDKMLVWFMSREKFRIVTETAYWKNGEERTKQIQVPNAPPHFSEFARELGTTEKQLKVWAKSYPEFAAAYEACKAIIKEFLIDNGLLKNYDPTFAKFAATNLTDMKEKTQQTNIQVDLNKILDKAEKSSSPFDDIDI